MPSTNRPFLTNFFAAFRTHSFLPRDLSSTSSSAGISASATSFTSGSTASSSQLHSLAPTKSPTHLVEYGPAPAPVSTASQSHPTSLPHTSAMQMQAAAAAASAAVSQFHSPRSPRASQLSSSPGTTSHTAFPRSTSSSRSRSPSASRAGNMRGRRGSDTSSDGGGMGAGAGGAFRDALAAERWYIGGRTASGEERFYKLGVVRRMRSCDRLSLDRLSLSST